VLIELSRQLDLLAQRPAIDGDLLILIVMAILWLVGGLAKVLMAKKGPAQQPRRQQEGLSSKPPAQRESWPQRLARKVREIQEAAQTERRTPEQQTHARDAATHPAGTIAIRENPRGESVMVYKRPAPQPIRKAVRRREAPEVGAAAEPPRPLTAGHILRVADVLCRGCLDSHRSQSERSGHPEERHSPLRNPRKTSGSARLNRRGVPVL